MLSLNSSRAQRLLLEELLIRRQLTTTKGGRDKERLITRLVSLPTFAVFYLPKVLKILLTTSDFARKHPPIRMKIAVETTV